MREQRGEKRDGDRPWAARSLGGFLVGEARALCEVIDRGNLVGDLEEGLIRGEVDDHTPVHRGEAGEGHGRELDEGALDVGGHKVEDHWRQGQVGGSPGRNEQTLLVVWPRVLEAMRTRVVDMKARGLREDTGRWGEE